MIHLTPYHEPQNLADSLERRKLSYIKRSPVSPHLYCHDIAMHSSRTRLALFLLWVGGLLVMACSGSDDPPVLDFCADAECSQGLSCDPEMRACRCDEFSCGEGRRCDDGARCVDDPQALCGWGTTWVDAEGCQCDDQACAAPFACSDDGATCEVAGDDRCLTDASGWDGESTIFDEIAADAGLVDLGVVGVRLSTADLTGNGAPDLLVRRSLASSDDFAEEERQTWLLANDGEGRFTDITEASGLLTPRYDERPRRGRPAEVFAVGDLNNNGHLDVVTLLTNLDGSQTDEGAEILLNDGEGKFELGPVSEPLHAAGQAINRGGLALVDIDGDGTLDLWIGSGAPSGLGAQQDLLLLGDGQGGFTDATAARGVETRPWVSFEAINAAQSHTNSWSAAACDLTGDGRPELLSASYGRAPNHLWVSDDQDGETHFTNHSIASGYAFDHRMDWTDNESARCYCMHNREDADCADVPEPQLITCNSEADAFRWNHGSDREPFRLGGNSGTTVCADLNNNGRLDLLTTEIVHWDVGSSSDPTEILYNTGDTPLRFDRPGNEVTGLERPRSGVVFDDGDITAAAFDFDNDGRLDILVASTDYPGTRAHLYHQQADGTFERVPVDLGIDLTSAHGIAVADFTGNGALDVALGHSRARCSSGDHCLDEPHVRLFANQVGQQANWLQLDLKGGPDTNRAAIGAQVEVTAGDLTRVAEVDGGHGHYGMQHGLTQHFGLGNTCEATVRIRWPDAEGTEEVYQLPAGYRFTIEQGQGPRLTNP